MKNSLLKELQQHVTSDKTYLSGGYYRIRELPEDKIEMAILVMDACGASAVHPQITLKKENEIWIPIKLIDLGVSPTEMYDRTEETKELLNQKLNELIDKFKSAIKNK